MTTQEMTRYDVAPLAPVVTDQQIDLIKRTVAAGATDAELQLYLYDCQRHGVHPLDKLLHFTKRSNKYTPITSIDLLRSRAADTGELAGIDDPRYQGEAGRPDFTATATVYRIVQGQRCPFSATARWSEYKPDQDHMWRKMPYLMLGKCAEALALRKAFPRQLAGLYAQEEMDQASTPARRADPRTGEILDAPQNGHSGPMASEKQKNYITGLQDKLGWHSEQMAAYASEQGVDLAGLTAAQASTLIEGLKMLAEERGKPAERPLVKRLRELVNECRGVGVPIPDLPKPRDMTDEKLDEAIQALEIEYSKAQQAAESVHDDLVGDVEELFNEPVRKRNYQTVEELPL